MSNSAALQTFVPNAKTKSCTFIAGSTVIQYVSSCNCYVEVTLMNEHSMQQDGPCLPESGCASARAIWTSPSSCSSGGAATAAVLFSSSDLQTDTAEWCKEVPLHDDRTFVPVMILYGSVTFIRLMAIEPKLMAGPNFDLSQNLTACPLTSQNPFTKTF